MLMKPQANRTADSRNVYRIAILLVGLMSALSPNAAFAQANPGKIRGFWVTGASAVTVRADRAILVMEIGSSTGLLEETVQNMEKRLQSVRQELDEQGLSGKYRFSSDHYLADTTPLITQRSFTSTSFRTPHCFEVKRYIIVTFDESDLAAPGFDGVIARAIDGLTRAGARQTDLMPGLGQNRFGGPVLFTLKDPQPVVLEAIRQAMAQARLQAEEVAKISGRKLGPIVDARVNRPLAVELPRQQDLTVFDELNVKYFSTSKDAVTIPATFAAQYSTK